MSTLRILLITVLLIASQAHAGFPDQRKGFSLGDLIEELPIPKELPILKKDELLGSILTQTALAALLNKEDKEVYYSALILALASGKSQDWFSDDARGSITVKSETEVTEERRIRVLKNRVSEMPPIEYIGEKFSANGNINLRGGPGVDYKVVDSVKKDDVIHVLGKVKDSDWYVIDQAGVVIGFVRSDLVTKAEEEALLAYDAEPKGRIRKVKTVTTSTCRTLEQRFEVDASPEQVETVEACQGPTGWKVVS